MEEKNNKIAAGIVLYNPDLKRLRENIEAVAPQVDLLILVENGSKVTSYLNEVVEEYTQFDVITFVNGKNLGIAYALNQICSYSYQNGYQWVLTLDQDSVVAPDIIKVYSNYLDDSYGIICPKVIDRNYSTHNEKDNATLKEIDSCITSGSLTNTTAWYKAGGFDTQMFIDWVDIDICYAMKTAGYKIMQTDKTHILHEIGKDTFVVRFWGCNYRIYHSPSFRYFYGARNRIYIARKWKKYGLPLRWQIREIISLMILSLKYEDHKWENFKAYFTGMIKGFFMPLHYNSV